MSEEAEAERARVAEEAASSAVTAFKSSMEMTKYLEGYYVTAVGDMIAQFQELEMLDPADYEVRLSEKGLEPPPMPHEVTPPFSQPTSTAEAEGGKEISNSSSSGFSCDNDRSDSNPETPSPTPPSQSIRMHNRRKANRGKRRG